MNQPTWIGYKLGGRYVIDEQLGQGGMSTVFRATDPNLRRAVAVKLIHSHLSDNPEFVRRFEEEAAAVAQLNHTNIIKVYDFNHDGDTYYMVLEYLPGETLQERLRRLNNNEQRLSYEETVRICADVCDAVDYAHRRGMLHRDIKPANIMLTVDGRSVLMDFGVVKMLGGEQHTATGAVIGTALYMSPEQVRGERPDERADIYSLGVMLFEMISGRPPFEADSAITTMMMHVNDPVPDIQSITPDTPPDLKAIIEKALSKSPDARFQSAAEMAQALRNAQLTPAPAATFIEQPGGAGAPEATFIEAPQDDMYGTLVETGSGSQPEPAAIQAPAPSAATVPSARTTPMGGEASPARPAGKKGLPIVALLGGGLFIIAVVAVIAGLVFLPGLLGGGKDGGTEAGGEPGGEEAAAVVEETATEAPTATPTDIPPPTETPLPTETPAPTTPPDNFVEITGITLEGDTYVVNYVTYNFEPALPGMHLHFFFNTVLPENAGMPGSGPWVIYAGPNPFTQYTVFDKPEGATQMCARVANPDHSLYAVDSGTCFDLPE